MRVRKNRAISLARAVGEALYHAEKIAWFVRARRFFCFFIYGASC